MGSVIIFTDKVMRAMFDSGQIWQSFLSCCRVNEHGGQTFSIEDQLKKYQGQTNHVGTLIWLNTINGGRQYVVGLFVEVGRNQFRGVWISGSPLTSGVFFMQFQASVTGRNSFWRSLNPETPINIGPWVFSINEYIYTSHILSCCLLVCTVSSKGGWY